MQIRFVSTLTAEDEDRLAQTIIDTAKGLLAAFPIGYMLRVETAGGEVFEHNRVQSTEALAGELEGNALDWQKKRRA